MKISFSIESNYKVRDRLFNNNNRYKVGNKVKSMVWSKMGSIIYVPNWIHGRDQVYGHLIDNL